MDRRKPQPGQRRNADGEHQIIGLLASIDRRLARIADAVCETPPGAVDPNAAYARAEAARLLGVSVWTIDEGRRKGLLVETERLGQRDVRLTGESLARFHRERQGQSKARVNRI